ncbi:hypothetical protein O9H85_33400 [Paenibacillus filicis]|uniref:Uncharacterized protein n=1 Tax=Paenibacillus gyeongsangnamensis TaxID=3388067 RepID=A0ABT4QJW0_9BACL|nr:hypothetical protein [Paenibacillus filicis]MCZ8517164.1 hypothetical protein [Paenibacillus filicis]
MRLGWYKKLVQTIVYLPHFLHWVIIGGLILLIFSQQKGIVNHFVAGWSGKPFPFLYNETSWMTIFVASGIWKSAVSGAVRASVRAYANRPSRRGKRCSTNRRWAATA